MTHIENVGELHMQNGETLFKMWHAFIEPDKRDFFHHYHSRFEIALVLSGSGIYTTPTGVFPMEPGDIFVFSQNEWHCITEIFQDGMEIINLHFEPRYLLGNSNDSLSMKHAGFCFSHSDSFQNRIPADTAQFIAQTILNIERELREQSEEYALCVKSHLNFLLISLIRNHNYCTNLPSHGTSKILKSLNYIDEHFTEQINLKDIADIVGLTPTYYSMLFKKFCNVSLWHYITAKRIEKAIHMILDDDYNGNILDIAMTCGFNNTANFNKAFKKQTGMTPSQYKKTDFMY